jgi:general secretion pathway protein I
MLEVLVAFVIAAMALGVLCHAAFSGLSTLRATSRYEQAISRARSHLAMATHTDPLLAGDWHGDDGAGFARDLRVTPVENTTIRPVNTLTLRGSSVFPLTLYAVDVQITWREGGATRKGRSGNLANRPGRPLRWKSGACASVASPCWKSWLRWRCSASCWQGLDFGLRQATTWSPRR